MQKNLKWNRNACARIVDSISLSTVRRLGIQRFSLQFSHPVPSLLNDRLIETSEKSRLTHIAGTGDVVHGGRNHKKSNDSGANSPVRPTEVEICLFALREHLIMKP